MNRTLLDEHLRIKGREKWYASGEEIQPDPDVVLGFCSAARRRHGWRLQGPAPAPGNCLKVHEMLREFENGLDQYSRLRQPLAPARGAGSVSTEVVYFG